ncbi:hypothetical protein D3C81_1207040 [compost metagenome]
MSTQPLMATSLATLCVWVLTTVTDVDGVRLKTYASLLSALTPMAYFSVSVDARLAGNTTSHCGRRVWVSQATSTSLRSP